MTEEEWLRCDSPVQMLEHFWSQAGDRLTEGLRKCRKFRLFACACCRRVWDMLADPRSRRCVEISEQYADGLAEKEVLQAAWLKAHMYRRTAWGGEFPVMSAPAAYIAAEAAEKTGWDHTDIGMAFEVLWSVQSAKMRLVGAQRSSADRVFFPPEAAWQCGALREIFGNPFRPVPFDSAWRTTSATVVARAIYEQRRFGDLPILADALEESGCTNQDIMDHCRNGQEHFRGCWVVDALLGLS